MVGNSAAEPDATGAQPLDAWTVASLMGGVECLCEHLGVLTETMLEQARAIDAATEPGAAGMPRPRSFNKTRLVSKRLPASPTRLPAGNQSHTQPAPCSGASSLRASIIATRMR